MPDAMEKLLQISASHPWKILLSLVFLTALAASQLQYLSIQVSAEGMAVEDDPVWQAQQTNRQKFNDSNVTVVLFNGPALFTPEKLRRIKPVIDELLAIEQVVDQTSLFSVANIRLLGENVFTRPYLDPIPDSQQALDEILRQANLNPLVAGNLVNRDGSALAVNLSLKNVHDDPAFDHAVSSAIEQVLSRHRSAGFDVFQVGDASIRDAITTIIKQDQKRIMPWSLLVLFVALAFGTRQIGGAFIPFFTAGISIVWTLAAMAVLDIPVGVMTSIVPALLIIIGSTEDVHLLAEYKTQRRHGLNASAALQETSKTIGVAILLTFVTTYLGFLSIMTNDISVLREFGLVASSGLLINFLVTCLSVPAILKITARKAAETRPETPARQNIYQRASLFVFRLAMQNARFTLLLFIAISIVALLGATRLKVNSNPLDYFDQNTEIVKNSAQMHRLLAGVQTFSILMETGIEDTFKQVRYLQEIEKIQRYLQASQAVDKSNSLADFIKLIHVVMEEDNVSSIDQLYLPDDDALVRDYMLFIDHDFVSSYVTTSYDSARIVVRHDIQNSSELRRLLDNLKLFIRENIDPAIQVRVAGLSVVSAHAADYMASGQFQSLILMGMVIFSLLGILFVNWKAGLVALIPNVFPVIVLFGVMGYAGIDLDTATAMVAVIALSICVDDTVHFMSRYHRNTRNRSDLAGTLEETVIDESVPIITTSIALMAGFLTFSGSSFAPIEYFGLLSALVILLALITTFVITPLLMSRVDLVTVWDMLSLKLQTKVVDNCVLFEGLARWQIKQSILASRVNHYDAGATIIEQGSIGDEMYVILQGTVNVKMTQQNGSVILIEEIAEGGVFGEIALVSRIPRTASVIAASDCRLLTLQWDSIERLASFHTRIASRLFKNLAAIVGHRLARLESQTISKDEYSGAMNRSMLQEMIDLEIEKCRRFHEPLTFVCFTLPLKPRNEGSNRLIRKISEGVCQLTRSIDIYGRWADQRFVMVFVRTDEHQGQLIADRISQAIDQELTGCGHQNRHKMTLWSYDGEGSVQQLRAQMDTVLNAPVG